MIGALIYPFVILFFLILALTIVMTYVVPQLVPMITSVTTDLSFSTRSLIWMSDFLRNNMIFLILVLIASALIFRGYTMTDSGRAWLDRSKLSIPVIGQVYKNYLIVQVMSTFQLLASSGVSIIKTIRLTGASSGNSQVSGMYSYMADDISK